MPVISQRTKGSSRLPRSYARTLYRDNVATLDDHREAVTTFEDTARIARRVLGNTHPMTKGLEQDVSASRAELRAHGAQA